MDGAVKIKTGKGRVKWTVWGLFCPGWFYCHVLYLP